MSTKNKTKIVSYPFKKKNLKKKIIQNKKTPKILSYPQGVVATRNTILSLFSYNLM